MAFDDAKISGDGLLFYINGNPLACEVSCEFSFTVDMKQISPTTAGGWQQLIPGIRSWQMSAAANFLTYFQDADFKTVLQAMIDGTPFQVAMHTGDDYSPAFFIGGTAYASSGTLSSSSNDIVGYTTVFQGSGPLTYSSEAAHGDYWRIINSNPSGDDKPVYYQSDL